MMPSRTEESGSVSAAEVMVQHQRQVAKLQSQITKLEAQLKEREWISVEERLPEIPEGRHAVSVIVYVVDDCCDIGSHVDTGAMFTVNGFECYVGVDNDGRNPMTGEKSSWCDYGCLGEHITHWQPLPPAPKE